MNTSILTPERAHALHTVCQMFLEAVKEGGDLGAPGGVMYAAVMDKISLGQFEQIMSALVAMKKVRRSGDRYFFVTSVSQR